MKSFGIGCDFSGAVGAAAKVAADYFVNDTNKLWLGVN